MFHLVVNVESFAVFDMHVPLQLCADTNLTNMQRQLALEVIVTLSETAAAMLRKHTAIVAQAGERPGYPSRFWEWEGDGEKNP